MKCNEKSKWHSIGTIKLQFYLSYNWAKLEGKWIVYTISKSQIKCGKNPWGCRRMWQSNYKLTQHKRKEPIIPKVTCTYNVWLHSSKNKPSWIVGQINQPSCQNTSPNPRSKAKEHSPTNRCNAKHSSSISAFPYW